ncbi:MAG: hypothetical protein MUE36_11220 [Acidimicrobiales bacterium]|nr:hypothetical protein [Acidimicrobiales bacterium]
MGTPVDVAVVTALVDLAAIDAAPRRTTEQYLALAVPVLGTRHHLVAHVGPELVEAVTRRRAELAPGAPTTVVACPWDELPAAGLADAATEAFAAGRRAPTASNPAKDTPAYLAVGWSKPGLLDRSAAGPAADADLLWWVDIGIGHVARPHPSRPFDDLLADATTGIRADVLWETTAEEVADPVAYYRDNPFSRVAGGLLGVPRVDLADLVGWVDAELGRCVGSGWPTVEEAGLGAVVAGHRDRFALSYGPWEALVANLDGLHDAVWHRLRLLADCRGRELHDRAVGHALAVDEAWRAGTVALDDEQVVALHDDLLVSGWWAGRADLAAHAARVLRSLEPDALTEGARARLTSDRMSANLALVPDEADPMSSGGAAQDP